MSHRTSAVVVADSISEYNEPTRLTSMYVVFPKMILGERNRHRAFSLSDRSSRAVPPEKLIQEVRGDPAVPALFRGRTKGMGGGAILTGEALDDAREDWKNTALVVVDCCDALNVAGLSKEIVNRPLDPFIRMHSLMTATRDGWMNFFGLRLDPAADPTIQVLAREAWRAYVASTPQLLRSGEWHLPFVDQTDTEQFDYEISTGETEGLLGIFKKLSAARCAHLSYNDLETGKRMTIERAMSIYDKLVGSRPLHASPLEHQATPDRIVVGKNGSHADEWEHPELHGNLHGWIQFRKTLSGEAVAPMPEGYR